MSDEADRAQESIEHALEIALKERRDIGPTATGFCLNCDTPLQAGHRWCDHDCCADWSKRRALNLHG